MFLLTASTIGDIESLNIIDAAGNRVHADEQLPFARDAVPK